MVRETATTEWSELYAHYLLRYAMQAVRTGDLQQLVLQRVARLGPAAPAAAASSSADADSLAELTGEFFGGLVQIACRSDQAAPVNGSLDPRRFLDELSAYVARELSRQEPAEDSEALVLRFGRLYFGFVGRLAEISAVAQQRSLRAFLAASVHAAGAQTSVELRAPCGQSACAELSIENTRDDRVTVSVRVSDVRRADGVGPAFAPHLEVQPEHLVLNSKEQASVRLSLRMDHERYEPGALYVGQIRVIRSGEPALELPLRIGSRDLQAHAP